MKTTVVFAYLLNDIGCTYQVIDLSYNQQLHMYRQHLSSTKYDHKLRVNSQKLTSFLDLSSSELKLLSNKAKKRLRTMKFPITKAGRKIAKQVPGPCKTCLQFTNQ